MNNIILTRFIHLKKNWISFIFWLVLPLIGTLAIVLVTDELGEESKIPIGVVIEESNEESLKLYQSIKDSSLLNVEKLNRNQALEKLEKHELDSVFIIKKGYESSIKKAERNGIITSYHSNLSFAYTPVKEMIISLVQQETGRSKTAYIVESLSKDYNQANRWTWDEIVETSEIVQEEENLLNSSLSYSEADDKIEKSNDTLINPWGIWAILSVLSMFFLFDWVVHERSDSTKQRFIFLKVPHSMYLLGNLIIYTLIFFAMDLITYFIIQALFIPKYLNFILVLLSFKFMILLGTFLIALCFRNLFNYYSFSVLLTLIIAIISGAIIPIKDITSHYPSLTWFNPFHAFLSEEITILWTVLFITLIMLWFIREETYNRA